MAISNFKSIPILSNQFAGNFIYTIHCFNYTGKHYVLYWNGQQCTKSKHTWTTITIQKFSTCFVHCRISEIHIRRTTLDTKKNALQERIGHWLRSRSVWRWTFLLRLFKCILTLIWLVLCWYRYLFLYTNTIKFVNWLGYVSLIIRNVLYNFQIPR